MKQWRLLCALLTLGVLCGCAAQQTTTTPSASPAPVAPTIKVQTDELPCASVSTEETLQINYPEESLYRSGAVLPKQEGLACLDVLSEWLKSQKNRMQIMVSGEEGYGVDPLALAEKRQQLLQQFFERKGVETKNLQWQALSEQGIQLQLTPATSSP